MSSTISAVFAADHRRCDAYFNRADEAVAARRWDTAGQCFNDFAHALKNHMRIEEEVLFPAFEARTGNTTGPTRVMRLEHQQFQTLIAEMGQALESQDAEHYLSLSAALATSVQQHGAKEEQVLYPWADRVLGDERDEILQHFQASP